MADLIYNKGLEDMTTLWEDGGTSTFKIALVKSGYTANKDHDFFDEGSDDAADPSFSELTVSGYSRQTVNLTHAENDTNDNSVVTVPQATFSSLAAGETIAGAILYRDTGLDTSSPLFAYLDVTDTPTNGSDIVVSSFTITLAQA